MDRSSMVRQFQALEADGVSPQAWSDFVSLVFPLIHAKAMAILDDRGLAEDAVQDILFLICRGKRPAWWGKKIEEEEAGALLWAWLVRITINHAINLRNKNRSLLRRQTKYGQHRNEAGPSSGRGKEGVWEALRDSLSRLPEKNRFPLILRFFQDLPYEKVGFHRRNLRDREGDDGSRSGLSMILYSLGRRSRSGKGDGRAHEPARDGRMLSWSRLREFSRPSSVFPDDFRSL